MGNEGGYWTDLFQHQSSCSGTSSGGATLLQLSVHVCAHSPSHQYTGLEPTLRNGCDIFVLYFVLSPLYNFYEPFVAVYFVAILLPSRVLSPISYRGGLSTWRPLDRTCWTGLGSLIVYIRLGMDLFYVMPVG